MARQCTGLILSDGRSVSLGHDVLLILVLLLLCFQDFRGRLLFVFLELMVWWPRLKIIVIVDLRVCGGRRLVPPVIGYECTVGFVHFSLAIGKCAWDRVLCLMIRYLVGNLGRVRAGAGLACSPFRLTQGRPAGVWIGIRLCHFVGELDTTLYGFIWPIAQGWSLYDHPNPLHLTVHQAGQSASCTVRCPFGTTLSLIPSFLLPRDLQCLLPEV